jgi:hypothetical protein
MENLNLKDSSFRSKQTELRLTRLAAWVGKIKPRSRAVHQPSSSLNRILPPRDRSRPRQSNRKSSRSQKAPSSTTKTIHLKLWIDPIVKREQQRIAEQEGVPVSH